MPPCVVENVLHSRFQKRPRAGMYPYAQGKPPFVLKIILFWPMASNRFRGISALLVSAAVFFAFADSAHAQSANLIQNPGFESGSGSTPTSWTKTYWGTPTPTFTYPVAGHGSAKAAQISFGSNSSGDARWAHAPVSVEPNGTYTFSSWYKSNAATEINVEFTNASGQKSYFFVAALPS